MNCVVKHCRSNWRPKSDIKFHSFPRDVKRRQLWLSIVPIKGKISESSKICSLHFKRDDYEPDRPGRLLSSATPFNMLLQPCECTNTKACTSVPSVQTISHKENLKTRKRDYRQSSKENEDDSDDEEDDSDNEEDDSDDEEDDENLSILKKAPVPSNSSFINNGAKEDDSDDEEDDENLSILKKALVASNSSFTNNGAKVIPCCNSAQPSNSQITKKTSNFGVQTKMKTDREISLLAKVKFLQQKLRRREAKISYMKTVLNIIKKHAKGTEVAYKLCCELQNMSESELDKSNSKDNLKRSQSPVSENESEEYSANEMASFFEVVHSPI